MGKIKVPKEVAYIRNVIFLLNKGRGLPEARNDSEVERAKSLLRKIGCSNLYVNGGIASLDNCKPARIMAVVKDFYARAIKQVPKFEKENPDAGMYRNLVEMLEQEKRASPELIHDARERTAIAMDSTPAHVLANLARVYGSSVFGGYAA